MLDFSAFESNKLPMHWVNGLRKSSISLNDRGLLYGDGLFETMRYQPGKIQLQHYHLQRMEAGCQILQMECPLAMIRIQLDQVVQHLNSENFESCLVKVILTRGAGNRGYAPPSQVKPSVIFIVTDISAPAGATAKLHLCKTRLAINPVLGGLKHLNRLEQVLAANELSVSGCEEGLMLDAADNVISGTRSNIFIVDNSTLLTPALDGCGISGTMRRFILEQVAFDMGLNSKVEQLSIEQVLSADEFFYCNSVVGVRPIESFVGRDYHDSVLTLALKARLTTMIAIS